MAMTTTQRAEKKRAREEQARRMAESQAAAQAVVQTGRCPQCGEGLRQNLAITGWWQCQQYGAEGFRKDSTKPSCSFQCFTH